MTTLRQPGDTSTTDETQGDVTTEQVDTTATTSTTEGDEQAQSSSAQDATEATLESVVRAAAAKTSKAQEPESSDRERSGDTATPEAEAAKGGEIPADAKTESESDVPFHKHPRWQAVLRERDTYKTGHEQFEQIQGFMRTNALEPQEVADGFEIMALIRRDPGKALERLRPFVEQLELVTGARLPTDLQQRVEDGVLDDETARETAQLRIERERIAQAAQYAQQQREVQDSGARVQSIQAAVTTVEQEIRSGDPDYARKQPFVMDRVRALIAEERPQTVEASVAIVRRAHNEISERLKPLAPQRKPVTPVTSGTAAKSATAAPTSMFDVVRAAAQRST